MSNGWGVEAEIEGLSRLERLEREQAERNRVRELEARVNSLEKRIEELASMLVSVRAYQKEKG